MLDNFHAFANISRNFPKISNSENSQPYRQHLLVGMAGFALQVTVI